MANGPAESETTDLADPDAADLDPAPGEATAGDDATDAAPAHSGTPAIGPSSGEDAPLASLMADEGAEEHAGDGAGTILGAPDDEVDEPTSVKEIIQRVSRLADEMANLAGGDRQRTGRDDEPRSAASRAGGSAT